MSKSLFSPAALASVLDPNDTRPTVVILSGLEGSNRSNWSRRYLDRHQNEEWHVITEQFHRKQVSLRNHISIADTYDPAYFGQVIESMHAEMAQHIGIGLNVMIDAPNLSEYSRRIISEPFPESYRFLSVTCLGNEKDIYWEFMKHADNGNVQYQQADIRHDTTMLWNSLPNVHQGFDDVRIISAEGESLTKKDIRKMKREKRAERFGDHAAQGAARS